MLRPGYAGAVPYRQSAAAMPLFVQPLAHAYEADGGRRNIAGEKTDAVARRIMERYAPPHVVVNEDYNVIRASGRTGKYLELAEGAPSNKITDLAKRGLRSALRSALENARKSRKQIIKRDVRIEGDDGDPLSVDLSADPLNDSEMLLVFQIRRDSPHRG